MKEMSTKKKFEEVSIECILKISYDIWDRSMEEYKKTMNECNNITYKDDMKYRYYHSKLTGDIALKLYRKYILIKTIGMKEYYTYQLLLMI